MLEIAAVAVLAMLEHLILFSMSDGDEDEQAGRMKGSTMYQKRVQAIEDKQNRLDNWLLEMRRAEEVRMMNGSPRPSSTIQGV